MNSRDLALLNCGKTGLPGLRSLPPRWRALTWKAPLSYVPSMKCWSLRGVLVAICLLGFAQRSPAPLIYTPGEGWRYEAIGGAGWQKTRAKDQLEVAQAAFDKKSYSLALKAARRTVNVWP